MVFINIFKKINYNTPAILTFTILSFLVTVLIHYTGDELSQQYFSVYHSSFSDPLTYVRLFGYVLGHSSLQHFLGNFLIILLVGPILEEKFGAYHIFYMILFTTVTTGLVQMFFFSGTALMGASGVAFMLILLSPFANVVKGKIPLTLIFVILLYFGREVYNGILKEDTISQMAHIIGGICGGVFGYLLNMKNAA